MPSELSPRDAELRRMLVAAADAAPLQRRRPRALVLLTVFAISGATGAGIPALLDAVLSYLPTYTATETKAASVDDGPDAEERPWSPL